MAALDNYEANLGVAKALSKAYGFRIYCFWQPSLYYGQKPLVPFEKQMPEIATRDTWSVITTAVYQEAATRATAGNFIFLGGLFDSVARIRFSSTRAIWDLRAMNLRRKQ